jgi:hypothetical protein
MTAADATDRRLWPAGPRRKPGKGRNQASAVPVLHPRPMHNDPHWQAFGVDDGTNPLNLVGILTPGPRLAALTGNRLVYRDGLPIAAPAGGKVQFLTTFDGTTQWEAQKRLMRSAVPALHADLTRAGSWDTGSFAKPGFWIGSTLRSALPKGLATMPVHTFLIRDSPGFAIALIGQSVIFRVRIHLTLKYRIDDRSVDQRNW